MLRLRLQHDTDFVRCASQSVAGAMNHPYWPDVLERELAEARQCGMSIGWSPEDEVLIASFPDVPFVRTHAAARHEAAEWGEKRIVALQTGMKDAGRPVTPLKIRV